MILAQISDTHIAYDGPDRERRIRDLEMTVADIGALYPAPDAIVHTGDIVHNGRRDEYAVAASLLARARAPVYVVAGNKDDRANLRAAFSPRGYLAPGSDFVEYAIDAHPIRLIALDTLSAGHNRGDFCDERVRRLHAAINADDDKPIAILTHHPPFEVTVGPDRLHFRSAEAMETLRRALRRSDRVVGVFSGHVHRATTGSVGDISANVTTCIATSLRRGEYPASMLARPVYQVHRFHADGSFATETRIVET